MTAITIIFSVMLMSWGTVAWGSGEQTHYLTLVSDATSKGRRLSMPEQCFIAPYFTLNDDVIKKYLLSSAVRRNKLVNGWAKVVEASKRYPLTDAPVIAALQNVQALIKAAFELTPSEKMSSLIDGYFSSKDLAFSSELTTDINIFLQTKVKPGVITVRVAQAGGGQGIITDIQVVHVLKAVGQALVHALDPQQLGHQFPQQLPDKLPTLSVILQQFPGERSVLLQHRGHHAASGTVSLLKHSDEQLDGIACSACQGLFNEDASDHLLMYEQPSLFMLPLCRIKSERLVPTVESEGIYRPVSTGCDERYKEHPAVNYSVARRLFEVAQLLVSVSPQVTSFTFFTVFPTGNPENFSLFVTGINNEVAGKKHDLSFVQRVRAADLLPIEQFRQNVMQQQLYGFVERAAKGVRGAGRSREEAFDVWKSGRQTSHALVDWLYEQWRVCCTPDEAVHVLHSLQQPPLAERIKSFFTRLLHRRKKRAELTVKVTQLMQQALIAGCIAEEVIRWASSQDGDQTHGAAYVEQVTCYVQELVRRVEEARKRDVPVL